MQWQQLSISVAAEQCLDLALDLAAVCGRLSQSQGAPPSRTMTEAAAAEMAAEASRSVVADQHEDVWASWCLDVKGGDGRGLGTKQLCMIPAWHM